MHHAALGRRGEHLRMTVADEEGTTQKVIWWQGAGWPLPEGRFDLACVVRTSDYRGQRDLQVEWVDARPIEGTAAVLRPAPPTIEVVDYRREPCQRKMLEQLRGPGVQVWSEAGAGGGVGIAGQDRHGLGRSNALVIWTTPPGPAEMQAVLERVSPEKVYLFSIDPGLDRSERLLARLAGLAKHALNANRGQVKVSMLAAAMAQREATVRAGLAWLAARGHVTVLIEDGDEMHLAAGSDTVNAGLPRITAQLRALLEETAAYRAHFARADQETLV